MNAQQLAQLTKGLRALSAVQVFFPRAILAGGFLRDVANDLAPKDIDLFIPMPSSADLSEFEKRLGAVPMEGAAEYMEQGEVSGIWDVPGFGMPVQVISLKAGLCPIDRAKHHDFGICQVWHDGEALDATPAFHTDWAFKTFTLVHCEDQKEFDRSMRRWQRLQEKFPEWTLQVPERFGQYIRPDHTVFD